MDGHDMRLDDIWLSGGLLTKLVGATSFRNYLQTPHFFNLFSVFSTTWATTKTSISFYNEMPRKMYLIDQIRS